MGAQTLFVTNSFSPICTSPLDVEFNLRSSADDLAKGLFSIQVLNAGAPTEVNIPTAPNRHTLQLTTYSRAFPARIHLPLTYEGTFELKLDTDHQPLIGYDANAPDPSGTGRHRTVQYYNTSPGIIKGGVSWVPDKVGPGSVSVDAFNGSISLSL